MSSCQEKAYWKLSGLGRQGPSFNERFYRNMTPSVLSNRKDIRHRFIYGSKKFVKQIKDRYISGDPDPALPQQKSRLALLNHRYALTLMDCIPPRTLQQLKMSVSFNRIRLGGATQMKRQMPLKLPEQTGS
jgi:hypothetical protein